MKHSFVKMICLLLAAMLLPLTAVAENAEPAVHTVEGKTYPHLYCFKDGEEPVEGEITLYFVDGGDIPYISLADFMPFLAGVEKAKADWDVTYEITVGANGMFMVTRPDNNSRMVVNTEEDTLLFPDFDEFINAPESATLVSILDLPDPEEMSLSEKMDVITRRVQEGNPMSDEEVTAFLLGEKEAEESLFALAIAPFNRVSGMLLLNLAEYNIDFIAQDGVCYLPFQTLNDIFIPPFYVSYVFNGQALIGAGKGNAFANKAYEAEPRPMSEEFAAFNFRELCFNLDHFYGLREEQRISSFADLIAHNPSLFSRMVGVDPIDFDSALSKLTNTYLDDGHSGFTKSSWYSGDQSGAAIASMYANLGMSSVRKVMLGGRFRDARNAAYPDGIPQYEEIDDTAFIAFDSFSIKRERVEDYYHLEDPDNPQDTVELILYAHRQITRENSPIRNIVIDLSMNGGGEATAALFVTAWFAGRAVIDLRNPLTDAQSIVTYMVDTNLNGKFLNDPGDTVAGGEYNLFCMTSPISFSCGNLLPACFRESGIVTLIGQKSGGGSCVVRPCTTASGAVFQISGTKELSTVINGCFYNIDQGIEPDIHLSKPASFYDRAGLVELIHATR